MKQLAALVVAVALVFGAIAARRAFADDHDAPATPTKRHRIVCDSAVASACEKLDDVDVTVERAGVTADRLGAGKPLGADAWVVAAPWVEIAKFGSARPRVQATRPLAHTRVSVVVRGATEAAACRDWACLAAPGIKIAHDNVDTTSGLAGIGALTGGHLGTMDFATYQMDDPNFDQWLDGVERSVNLANHSAAVVDQLQTSGGFQVALGLAVDTSELSGKVATLDLTQSPAVDVVIAGDAEVVDRDALVEALTEDGWQRGRGASTMKPGVLYVLRQRVKDVNR